ncbi:hypothetical protein K3U94_14925 [Mycolicibacter heraklionensis]|uniref:Uncharacterized protein n=1 Tax=Mycolicibacter heraklionensis TaxID=512402 RepID=A0A9X7ZF27_9MYCO|nr:hypothetical protein [Mycolicibacter heraklionensis]QZA06320.1 hypothetical protein K3U94_14925 [Mycolicibacter heraklionensis]
MSHAAGQQGWSSASVRAPRYLVPGASSAIAAIGILLAPQLSLSATPAHIEMFESFLVDGPDIADGANSNVTLMAAGHDYDSPSLAAAAADPQIVYQQYISYFNQFFASNPDLVEVMYLSGLANSGFGQPGDVSRCLAGVTCNVDFHDPSIQEFLSRLLGYWEFLDRQTTFEPQYEALQDQSINVLRQFLGGIPGWSPGGTIDTYPYLPGTEGLPEGLAKLLTDLDAGINALAETPYCGVICPFVNAAWDSGKWVYYTLTGQQLSAWQVGAEISNDWKDYFDEILGVQYREDFSNFFSNFFNPTPDTWVPVMNDIGEWAWNIIQHIVPLT